MNIKVRPNKNALTRGYINCTQKQSNIAKIKEEQGITLIVLLVTVILLVILASVAIVQITGDEGIITSTEVAVDEYDYQQYKENISLQQAYQDRVEEYEHIKDIVGNLDENGYYNVYSDGELIIYGEGDDIVIVR